MFLVYILDIIVEIIFLRGWYENTELFVQGTPLYIASLGAPWTKR